MEEQILANLGTVGMVVVIILLTLIVAFLVNRFFKRLIKKSSGDINNDPTNYLFLRHAAVAIVYLVGFGLAISVVPFLRTVANSLLAGAGILAVAVGFASQHALSNIISGVFIIVFRPFRVNDRLEIRTMSGVVEDITLRHTVIRNFENRRIIIPNSIISDEIIVNADFKDQLICKWVNISISYDSDIPLAKAIMREEVLAHPLILDNRTAEQKAAGQEQVPVRVLSLGDSSVDLRAWAWAKDNADAFVLGCDLLESIKRRFEEVGIEIPYPHRTLVQKGEKK